MANERSAITGKWYKVLRQQKSESCAAASVRMMGLYINGTDPGEGTTRCFITLAEVGNSGTLGSGGLVSEDATAHDFTNTGTLPQAMVGALGSLRPAIAAKYIWETATTKALKDKMAEVGPKNPMIIGVYWNGGGGHVMVGVEKHSTGRIIVADPGYGVGFIEPDGIYRPVAGVQGYVVLTVSKT